MIEQLFDVQFDAANRDILRTHPNPLNRVGYKCFSQNEEDGILLEILRRIRVDLTSPHHSFLELGVGDGMENNTLILAALGWHGVWVGGQPMAWDALGKFISPTVNIINQWIDRTTVDSIITSLVPSSACPLRVVSVDLDGVDYYIVEEMLKRSVRPDVWVVEYNAKFPLPVQFTVPYRDNFVWDGTDFFGASLASWIRLMGPAHYELVATNALSGSNAFFVRNDLARRVHEVPLQPSMLINPPRYTEHRRYSHPQSLQTVMQVLRLTPSQS